MGDLFAANTPAGDESSALIALSLVPGVGTGRIRALLAQFRSAQAALGASVAALKRVPGLGPQTAKAIASFNDWARVEQQLHMAEQVGARLVLGWEDAYPAALKEIYDPPAFLWVRGAASFDSKPAIAIVGTRRATDYGKRVARKFAEALIAQGFVVVSGLAYGIDTAAHRAVVDAGGETWAVLGSGVDVLYPARNTQLAERILKQGILISEYPLGAKPDAPNFPRRNRIISGLTVGTLVIEAFETGGALITARLALAQNREVFAVPNGIYSQAAGGTNRLIQAGHAKLVQSVEDILDELDHVPALNKATTPARLPDLHPVEKQLFAELKPEPMHIDALCEATGVDVSTALVYLLGLEFKGLAHQLPGKQFCRTV